MGGSPGIRSNRKAPLKYGIMENETILIGDVIKSRKPHPCGSDEWTVIRTGADIKMKCNKCARIVMLDRETFLRRRKAVISHGPDSQ